MAINFQNPFSGLQNPLTGARNPFRGVGSALAEGLLPRLGAQREMERQIEAMNPLREAVLGQLGGRQPVPFAGGPMSEPPGGAPGAEPMLPGAPGQPMPQAPGVTATPADPMGQPRGERARLPPDLTPPPQIDSVLREAAERHGVPVNALRALAAQESSFRPDVVGGTPIDLPGQEGDRARGLFQFTPAEIAKMPGFDPNDPAQAADETARRLRARLEEGKPIDIALMEHFGGPDQRLHGPRTRRYYQEINEKFQRLEEATGGGAPQAPQVGRQMPEGLEAGPFGTLMAQQGPQRNIVQNLLAEVARDPRMFAQQFAGEGGLERIVSMLQGGDGTQQTRVVSGDSPEGQALGIAPGERARVSGVVTSNGTFVPQEVKATPFVRPTGATGEGDPGGPVITLMDMQAGQVVSRRRDDPEVDSMIRSGRYVVASDGRAVESLEQMSQGERRELRNAQVGARTYIETVADAIDMLNQNPDINTFVARGASLINDIRTEARALAGAMGTEFDEDIFNVSAYQNTFQELGIERERMQSMITSLAFQRAVAEKGGAGRITNRDIERFIAEIGGRSSDPVALAQVLQDTAQRAARSFRINWETRTGAPFEGDLGLDRMPRFAPRDQFDPAREPPRPGAAPPMEVPTISSDAEYEALPSGTEFIAPDGTRRRKP